eukprot:1575808-Alexandrium_andersonii.AAC.1
MSASSTPKLLSGSSTGPSAAARSNTAMPRSILPCTRWGIGRPPLACWAAMPRRIAVQGAGGWMAAWAVRFLPSAPRPCSTARSRARSPP